MLASTDRRKLGRLSDSDLGFRRSGLGAHSVGGENFVVAEECDWDYLGTGLASDGEGSALEFPKLACLTV